MLFDKVQSGEGIWAAILEKAWAKVNGNYDITAGGWMNEAVGFLTGVPTLSWSNTDAKTVNSVGVNAWNLVQKADAVNFIMTATVGNACGSDSSYSAYHLPCGHAYTLLGAYAIKNSAGTVTNRLLQIRNPWGSDAGYNGTWNDGDATSWSAAAKSQVPFTSNINDGVFWVEDKDFVKAFDGFSIH